jgi:hypothetical protein
LLASPAISRARRSPQCATPLTPSCATSGGDLVDAAQALIVGDRQFSDYYVVTKYVVSAGDTALVNCWGAFTQTQCSRVRTTEAAQ